MRSVQSFVIWGVLNYCFISEQRKILLDQAWQNCLSSNTCLIYLTYDRWSSFCYVSIWPTIDTGSFFFFFFTIDPDSEELKILKKITVEIKPCTWPFSNPIRPFPLTPSFPFHIERIHAGHKIHSWFFSDLFQTETRAVVSSRKQQVKRNRKKSTEGKPGHPY